MPRVTACSTMPFAGGSLDEAFRRIATLGFERVEIAAARAHDRPAEPAAVRALLEQHRLAAASVHGSMSRRSGYDVRRPADARAYADGVHALVDYAGAVGAGILIVPAGERRAGPEAYAEMRAFAALLSRLADEAAVRGVRLSVELPHPHSIAPSIGTTLDFFELATSSNLITTVNSACWGAGRYDIFDVFAKLGAWAHHVHLQDCVGRDSPGAELHMQVTPGQGQVDFSTFGAVLDEFEYAGDVVLEVAGQGRTPAESEQQLRAALAYLAGRGWTVPAGA